MERTVEGGGKFCLKWRELLRWRELKWRELLSWRERTVEVEGNFVVEGTAGIVKS